MIATRAAASLALGLLLAAPAQAQKTYTTQGYTPEKLTPTTATAPEPARPSPAKPPPPAPTTPAKELNQAPPKPDDGPGPGPVPSAPARSGLIFGPLEPGLAAGGQRAHKELAPEPDASESSPLPAATRLSERESSLLSLSPPDGAAERERGPSVFNGRWIGYGYGSSHRGSERAPGFACEARASVEDDLFEVEAMGRSFRAQRLSERLGGSRVSGADDQNASEWSLSHRRPSPSSSLASVSAENSDLDWRCALARASDFHAALARAERLIGPQAGRADPASSVALVGFELKEGYLARSCAALISPRSMTVLVEGQAPLSFERDTLAFERRDRLASIGASTQIFYKGASAAFTRETAPASQNAVVAITAPGLYLECQLAPMEWWRALASSR